MPLTLAIINDFLKKDGIFLDLLPPTADLPIEHLILLLGKDYKNRELRATIWLEEQTEAASDKQAHVFMQLLLVFPFIYKDSALLQTARYLLMVNKAMAFPGLGLSEPDHSLYYKYTLLFPEGRIHMDIIKEFIGFLQFMYDTFAPKIEQLANGTAASLEDLL